MDFTMSLLKTALSEATPEHSVSCRKRWSLFLLVSSMTFPECVCVLKPCCCFTPFPDALVPSGVSCLDSHAASPPRFPSQRLEERGIAGDGWYLVFWGFLRWVS